MAISKVDFIGIGAQKAATTWIYKCLIEHPGICGFAGKENNFFSIDKKYREGIGSYLENFEHCSARSCAGEYSTTYLSSEKAAKRIHSHLPDVKILACLRQPIDRLYSNYLHLVSKKNENKTLRDYIFENKKMIESGMYGRYLNIYFDLFSRENILVLFYEDIKKDPVKFIQGLYRFLGVDETFVPEGATKKYHTSKARNSVFYKKINKLYLKNRKKKFGKFAIKYLKKLGLNSYVMNDMINKFSKSKLPEITEEDKKYIYSFYKDDIVKLEKLLNKDLSHWKYESN